MDLELKLEVFNQELINYPSDSPSTLAHLTHLPIDAAKIISQCIFPAIITNNLKARVSFNMPQDTDQKPAHHADTDTAVSPSSPIELDFGFGDYALVTYPPQEPSALARCYSTPLDIFKKASYLFCPTAINSLKVMISINASNSDDTPTFEEPSLALTPNKDNPATPPKRNRKSLGAYSEVGTPDSAFGDSVHTTNTTHEESASPIRNRRPLVAD